MRFTELLIENFRGIRRLHLQGLEDTIVVAGPNGCGKSSIFDAIRLWKSAYAGYQGDEIQSWLAEFGMSNNVDALRQTLQSASRPMLVEASIILTENEKAWLRSNGPALIREAAYRRLVPNYHHVPHPMPGMAPSNRRSPHITESLRVHEPAVQQQIDHELPLLMDEIDQKTINGRLICLPDGQAQTVNSVALARVFSVYDGINIGVIDYHGPHRNFAREEVGGINLQIEQYQNQRQQNALYNSANKYNGIKTELAVAYVRDLIARESGERSEVPGMGLEETLVELFRKFFPGKTFDGVKSAPDGSLKFEVETRVGKHDINDLSSGEKELLYGYLRLRNHSPENSIILLDEPELHLNPRLTDGLAEFYHNHLGKALNNQLWLLTHSDTILRQSMGRDGCKVIHMLSAGNPLAQPEQAIEVTADDDVERAVIDLVGDLAGYKPGAKLVFIEGGGTLPFDEKMISDLFPQFAASVNLITSGNKTQVRRVSSLLEHARSAGAAIGRAFAITDQDNEQAADAAANCYQWDRYHIENYLLEPDFIGKGIVAIGLGQSIDIRVEALLALLKGCAADTIEDMVRHEFESESHSRLKGVLSTSTQRGEPFDVFKLRTAMVESQERIAKLLAEELSEKSLESRETLVRARFEEELESGAWIKTFRGRDILKRFISKHLGGCIRYELFRNMIVSYMVEAKFQPVGVADVIERIEKA